MTKERILNIASEEFSKHGYSAVSMNSLVTRLEVNKATIYYHYKDKKALYHEVLKTSLSDSKANREKLLIGITDPKERFRAFLKGFLQTIKEKPYMVGLWMHEVANFGSNMDESLTPIVEEMVLFLKELLDELPLKQEYKSCNPYIIFSIIHGTIDSFYAVQMSPLPVGGQSDLKLNADNTLDFLDEFLANFILNAICKEESK